MDLNTSARSPNIGDIRWVRSGMNNAFALQKSLVAHVSVGSFASKAAEVVRLCTSAALRKL